MDKYSEKATEISSSLDLSAPFHEHTRRIAQALRESAAEALSSEAQHWEDLLRPGQEVSGSEVKARLWMVADLARAAALRDKK